jgi:hypothetical protein
LAPHPQTSQAHLPQRGEIPRWVGLRPQRLRRARSQDLRRVCLKLGGKARDDRFERCEGCGGYASPKYKDENFCEKCYPKYSRAAFGLPVARKAAAGGAFTGEDVAMETGEFVPVGKGFDLEEAE